MPEVEVHLLKGAERVVAGDVTLFEQVLSQTSPGCRRSLLAVQRVVAQESPSYVYLEIGSFRGGTLQPHLADERCTKIYSIDPRPEHVPNGRGGSGFRYPDNSSEGMLKALRETGLGDIAKVHCIEKDAKDIELGEISERPMIAFIDGEHTVNAALSDYAFCRQIIQPKGIILFHDFSMILPALRQICRALKKEGEPPVGLKLEGGIFAVFLDPEIIQRDAYLTKLYAKNRNFLFKWRMRMALKNNLPSGVFELLRRTRKSWWALAE